MSTKPGDGQNAMLGRKCIERCNTGILRVARDTVEPTTIESYLKSPEFWGHWYAEQTLYALELTSHDAEPLPRTYAIAPSKLKTPRLVSGHFCGEDSKYRYYVRGIPHLLPILLERFHE